MHLLSALSGATRRLLDAIEPAALVVEDRELGTECGFFRADEFGDLLPSEGCDDRASEGRLKPVPQPPRFRLAVRSVVFGDPSRDLFHDGVLRQQRSE